MLELRPCAPQNVNRQLLLFQIHRLSQCCESRGQGWSPYCQIPPRCLWPSFPWHCWVRGSRLGGKRTALWITLLTTAAAGPKIFSFLSLVWWQSWKLQRCRLVLHQGKMDVDLANVVSVRLSLLVRSSFLPFFEQCPSLKRRPSSRCGGWIVAGEEAALGSLLATASQSDGDAHSCGRHQRGEGPYGFAYFFCPSQQHA